MRMTQEFQVLNLSFDTIVGITTQLCPVNKLEGNELFRLLMFSHYYKSLSCRHTSNFSKGSFAEGLYNAEIAQSGDASGHSWRMIEALTRSIPGRLGFGMTSGSCHCRLTSSVARW